MNPKLILSLALVSILLPACGRKAAAPLPPAPPVTVAVPAQEEIADAVDLTGTVAASQSVDLVARVAGFLKSANFEDGAFVEAGQLLFVIEPDSYEQQMRTAESVLQLAQLEYDRQLALNKQGATTPENIDKALSARDQAAAQAELAKLSLSYTRVTAPFSGRMGRRLVDPGNLVGPAANSRLATIQQLVPIHVYFNLNERDALVIRTAIRQAAPGKPFDARHSPVWVGLQNEEGYPHAGEIDFVDSGINTATGTVQLRAVLKNEDRVLVPGFFARVRIPLGPPRPTLVVPNRVIGNDQEGDYVLVADANDIVVRHAVVKGSLTARGCAIRSGLAPDDRVIVNGLMQARPGQKVAPVTAVPAP
jgi:RND family efflux transporter MFP subunit